MTVAEPQPAVPKPKLRWYQVRFRVLVPVAILALYSLCVAKGHQEQNDAAVVEKCGGTVTWSHAPTWIRVLFGDGVFTHVVRVDFIDVNDAALKCLKDGKAFTQAHYLSLDGRDVTDAGLESLVGLSQLHALAIHDTKVTEAGVKRLQQALPNCKIEWTLPAPMAR